MIVEKKVTISEPAISGQMPNSGGSYVGYHSEPKMNLKTETARKMGKASLKRKTIMSANINREASATRKNTIPDYYLF